MNHDDLREQFREFVGDDECYRKFITACNRSPGSRRRLRFWQEKLWQEFTEKVPAFAGLEASVVLEAFYICHVHLTPLHPVSIPIRKGLWCELEAPSPEPHPAPYSRQYALDSSSWGDATHTEFDHCDECLSYYTDRNGAS